MSTKALLQTGHRDHLSQLRACWEAVGQLTSLAERVASHMHCEADGVLGLHTAEPSKRLESVGPQLKSSSRIALPESASWAVDPDPAESPCWAKLQAQTRRTRGQLET